MCWRSRAIASSADSPLRLVLWPKRIIYLLYALGALGLARSLGLPWIQSALTLIPLLIAEAVLHQLARRRQQVFEGRLLAYLQAGRDGELLALLAGQRLLRFAAPRHYLRAKQGMIFSRLGRHPQAVAAFSDALEEAPKELRFAAAMGLADSLLALERHAEAERAYRLALEESPHHSPACANLGRLILRREGDPQEAISWLARASESQRDLALRCELIQLLLAGRQLEQAQQQLARARQELPGEATVEQREQLARLDQMLAAAQAELAAMTGGATGPS